MPELVHFALPVGSDNVTRTVTIEWIGRQVGSTGQGLSPSCCRQVLVAPGASAVARELVDVAVGADVGDVLHAIGGHVASRRPRPRVREAAWDDGIVARPSVICPADLVEAPVGAYVVNMLCLASRAT
jgi:hypothetical protein